MPASYRNQLARSTATGPKQPKRLTASSDRYRCITAVQGSAATVRFGSKGHSGTTASLFDHQVSDATLFGQTPLLRQNQQNGGRIHQHGALDPFSAQMEVTKR
jgi:hypothetical protein